MGEMNERAYQKLIDGNIDWLLKQPFSLEREHIEECLRWLRENRYRRPQQEDAGGEEILVSQCCAAPVIVLRGETTQCYVCKNCGEACDVGIPAKPTAQADEGEYERELEDALGKEAAANDLLKREIADFQAKLKATEAKIAELEERPSVLIYDKLQAEIAAMSKVVKEIGEIIKPYCNLDPRTVVEQVCGRIYRIIKEKELDNANK